MATMNFQPGGAEDDDDFDEDGFYIGDSNFKKLNQREPLDPVLAVSSSHANREGFKGFGIPPPKAQRESGKSFKRSSDRDFDGNNRTLDMGDFQMAIVRRQYQIVKQYLEEGFKVDTVLKSGWTGLMYAASHANPQIVYELLHHSADPNFHKDMYTVLMAACGAAGYSEQDVLECVTLLLEKGAKVDECDRYHTTALMYAAREGRSTVIRQLVESGASVNKQNNRGWTALTWAVSKQQIKAVRTLLEDNADPRIKHCDGQTVLDMALQMEDEQMLAILEGREPDLSCISRQQDGKTPAQNGVSTSKNNNNQTSISVKSSGTTYGELELFLCGLELSSLVDLFRDQKVTFDTFLLMTEEDLIQMGISQIGVRKKIIDGIHAVHKKEWDKSSLPAIQYNKQLSCAECIAMVANIAKHTKYITTTVSFLQDQLKKKPDILDELEDSTGPKQLHQHTVDTCQNITVLENQLKTLKLQLSMTLKTGNFNPPDLIKKPVNSQGRSARLIALFLSASALSVVVWKRQFLAEKFVELIMPVK